MFFHFLFNAHSANLLPNALLPQDDRVGFVEEETLVLQSYPDYSVFHWVVVVSERLGIPHLVITIWEPPTCTLQRTRILRRVFVLPYQEVWTLYPELLSLPSVKVMRLVR